MLPEINVEITTNVVVNPNEGAAPDGKKAAFIKDWNLWIRNVATKEEVQLTFDVLLLWQRRIFFQC